MPQQDLSDAQDERACGRAQVVRAVRQVQLADDEVDHQLAEFVR
ncbi:hypothetical protein [Streptomyces sp. NPDC101149]